MSQSKKTDVSGLILPILFAIAEPALFETIPLIAVDDTMRTLMERPKAARTMCLIIFGSFKQGQQQLAKLLKGTLEVLLSFELN